MRFMMLMIPKGYEKAAPGTLPDASTVAAMMRYNDSLRKAGALLALDGLHPPSMGARVSFAGGRPRVTDGPFAEVKEVVGGYWMIQVKSREEAIEWASRCPASDNEVIEIRQVQEASDFAPKPESTIQVSETGGGIPMRYMMLYRPGRENTAPPTQEELTRMGRLIEEMTKAGVLIATGGLQHSSTGARVRKTGQQVTVTDGPFSETKELIGGYAIVEATSKAHAIELARRFLDVAGEGETEIRPMHVAPDLASV